ncbi:DUF4150 domain-containing protein [Pseudoalteromonas luteoviolacea]
MMSYINAGQGKQAGTVQYDIDATSAELRSGGSQTWRHNNPVLLGLTAAAKRNGALGQASGVAVFADKSSGESAFRDEIDRPKYSDHTLGDLITEFIPDYIIPPPEWDEEANQPILPHIEPVTGMDVNKPVNDADALLRLASEELGWEAGEQSEITKDTEANEQQVRMASGKNVLINGRSAVHVESKGKLMSLDICLTTIGIPVVPIPYCNVAKTDDITNTASSVKINGNPAGTRDSEFTESTGDQPGDKKGIMSGVTEGKAEFMLGSFNVFIENQPAVRQGDIMISNNKNTPPSPLMQSGSMPVQRLSVENRPTPAPQEGDKNITLVVSGISNSQERIRIG